MGFFRPGEPEKPSFQIMKKRKSILFCAISGLLLSIILAGCVVVRGTVDQCTAVIEVGRNIYRCTAGAHRGDSSLYTENSPEAIRSARSNPDYAFIEFDVQYSADKIPVVLHDTNLLRTFGHLNKVKKTTFTQLQKLSGGEIATLDAILDLAAGKCINIEIKSQGDDAEDRQLIDDVVKNIHQRGIAKQVLLSSISEEAVAYSKKRYPTLNVGQVCFLEASAWLPFDALTEKLYSSPADYIMLHRTNLKNIRDLIKLKPADKTLVFWDFSDTMYIVHKDPTDRLWDNSTPPGDLKQDQLAVLPRLTYTHFYDHSSNL